ncbi:MAG TPA: site-specific DNA-methyltransferase [Ignavibacteria bacterium]|nr:site-specific DNA-methyltransferase [Ignavibacteria bacterium]
MDKIFKYSYKTRMGFMINDDSLQVLNDLTDNEINLVITSPPFPLLRKKEYGNKEQFEYIDWLLTFAKLVYKKLTPDGSFVIDLGGVYQKGVPIRSLYNFRLLLKLCDEIGFNLAEEFYWYNPSKLPSPIEWVNKRKIRTKDSVNTVWWLSKTENPKSDVSKVLVPYSERMKKLIKSPSKFYKPKLRPSGHNIGKNFSINNGGAIPSNLLNIPNSESNSLYFRRCKAANIKTHPARFPEKLPKFFIKMLTDEGDLVVDIFAGSNTTGLVSEKLLRKWISIENRLDYVSSSVFRFIDESISNNQIIEMHNLINDGKKLDISNYQPTQSLFDVDNKNVTYSLS